MQGRQWIWLLVFGNWKASWFMWVYLPVLLLWIKSNHLWLGVKWSLCPYPRLTWEQGISCQKVQDICESDRTVFELEMAAKGCDLDTSWLVVIDKMAVKRQLCHHAKDELDRDQIWHLATTCWHGWQYLVIFHRRSNLWSSFQCLANNHRELRLKTPTEQAPSFKCFFTWL